MAMINDVVARQFRVADHAHSDPELVISTLDSGLYSAGRIVASLRDQVLHGSPGTGSAECDVEEVSCGLEGLLAYLGQLGQLVDQLDGHVEIVQSLKSREAKQIEMVNAVQEWLYDAIRLLGMVQEQSSGPSAELEKMDRIALLADSILVSTRNAMNTVDLMRQVAMGNQH